MKRIGIRIGLIVLALVLGVVIGRAYQPSAAPSRKDTAIINDWYQTAVKAMDTNLNKADDLINKAWKMSIDIAYSRGIADGYYYTGRVYTQKNAPDIAGRYFEKAISLYIQGQFAEHLADSYRRLGEIYMGEGRYFTAFQHFVDGLRVAEDQHDAVGQVELSVRLAEYHSSVTKDYREAVATLDAVRRQPDTRLYAAPHPGVHMQYSIAYSGLRRYNLALQHSRLARQSLGKSASRPDQLGLLLVEGDIYAKMRDLGRLNEVLEEARKLLEVTDEPRQRHVYELLQATAWYLAGDYARAWNACQLLYGQLSDVSLRELRHQTRALHVKIAYALGNFSAGDSLFDALEYSKDSLYAVQYVGQGIEFRENYKLEKFERQIKEQELLLANTRYQRYGLIAGIIVLLTILGILYFHFREKDKLAHRVALKNAEISVQNEVLKQANKQNELLLREIHHRVKNNLQIINSLLSLQSRKSTNQEVVTMMQESCSRIHSIALIHNKLYQQQSINRLSIQDYIEQLGEHLLSIYNVGNKQVNLHVDADEVSLDIDTAIPVGLILTELMTNSLKYAFIDRESGEIRVQMKHDGGRDYELIFQDNGVGIPENKLKQTDSTLGFRLIHSLTRQLAGIIHYTNGALSTYHIRFKG